jgi:hypothetical protein
MDYFDEDTDTICAECGLVQCQCEHYRHDCNQSHCDCGAHCVCCVHGLCTCDEDEE